MARSDCLSEETLLGVILDEEFPGRLYCEAHVAQCARCQAEMARLQDDIEEANRQKRPYKSTIDRFLDEIEEFRKYRKWRLDPVETDLSLI